MPNDGPHRDTRPSRLRTIPDDFRDRFLELGYSPEIQEHYATNWRVIRRWIEEAGGDQLRMERRLWLLEHRPVSKVTLNKRRWNPVYTGLRRRYVMGRTLRKVGTGKSGDEDS